MNLLAVLFAAGVLGGPSIDDELSRLRGHDVVVNAARTSYEIRDICGEGRPLVGHITRRGPHLFLTTPEGDFKLTGPLAIPRISGPGYKVWVIGKPVAGELAPRRLGILAPPTKGRLAK